MNMRRIAYWIATVLIAFVFMAGGVAQVVNPAAVREGITHLGYPAYFGIFLNVWKVLGGIAILAPRLPRLKEWAYAGMTFDLIAAAVSHAAVGDPVGNVVAPFVFLGILAASWALRPGSRKLGAASGDLGARPHPKLPAAHVEMSK